MLRLLMAACLLVVVPLQGHANPTAETETEEMDFLEMVDGEGNVLVKARGVDAVNAEAQAWHFLPWCIGLLRVTAL